MIKFRRGPLRTDIDTTDLMAAAILKWSKSNAPADQAEVMRLYEEQTGYKAGCGACIAGRRMFAESLSAMVSGDRTEAAAKMKGALASARFKFDVLRDKLGL